MFEISILAVLADRDAARSALTSSESISILAVLADRDIHIVDNISDIPISILAVLADRDVLGASVRHGGDVISILAVLADRDGSAARSPVAASAFQSSRSLRTATIHDAVRDHFFIFQSSRSLRTATMYRVSTASCPSLFQSSRSLRTATPPAGGVSDGSKISILAVLADRDGQRGRPWPCRRNFNPRGPCGPRPLIRVCRRDWRTFQSSRSLRTATIQGRTGPHRAENFNPCGRRRRGSRHFNPRGPCGPRPVMMVTTVSCPLFQSSRSLRTATPCGEL